jgi:hypothetical protein
MFTNWCKVWFFSLSISIYAGGSVDPDILDAFYNEFVCEEKNITSEIGLTQSCSELPPVPPTPSPPSPFPPGPPSPFPPPPPPSSCGQAVGPPSSIAFTPSNSGLDYLPIVLVNNTGLGDDEVYFVIYGQVPQGSGEDPTNELCFVSFGPQNNPVDTVLGTLVMPTSSLLYSYNLSQIPSDQGQKVIYIPYLNSGEIFFSIGEPLNLTVTPPNSIATPKPNSTTDPTFGVVYGQVELTFFPPNIIPSGGSSPFNQVSVDISVLNYYGMSIYLDLFTQNPDPNGPNHQFAGIYQGRHYTLCSIQSTFQQAAPSTFPQWEGLILKDGSKILRVLSPGHSMSGSGDTDPAFVFDRNYLDNKLAYGYSWAENVWTGANAYYKTYPLTIITSDMTIFTGKVNSDNQFVFTSKFIMPQETITIPWVTTGITTTEGIYNVSAYFPEISPSLPPPPPPPPPLSPIFQHENEITKTLASGFFVGILPGIVNKLTPQGPPGSVVSSYYLNNPYLPSPGDAAGPWTDLFSRAILGNTCLTGNTIYTYPYTDYLYQQYIPQPGCPNLSGVAPSLRLMAGPNGTANPYVTIFLGPYQDF